LKNVERPCEQLAKNRRCGEQCGSGSGENGGGKGVFARSGAKQTHDTECNYTAAE